MVRDDMTTARAIRTHGSAMSEASDPVGGSRRTGAGEVGEGGVGVVAAVAAADAAGVQAAATLWGGLWMLGGGDIVPVPRVVRGKRIEGVGTDRRHLGDGVRVDPVSPCLALLPPFVFSSPLRDRCWS